MKSPALKLNWKHYLSAVILLLSAVLNFSTEIQGLAASCGVALPHWINFALLVIIAFCDSVLPVLKRLGLWFLSIPVDSMAAAEREKKKVDSPGGAFDGPGWGNDGNPVCGDPAWGTGGDNPPTGGSAIAQAGQRAASVPGPRNPPPADDQD